MNCFFPSFANLDLNFCLTAFEKIWSMAEPANIAVHMQLWERAHIRED